MEAWNANFEIDWDPPGCGWLKVRATCDDGSKCEFEFRLDLDTSEQLHTALVREFGSYLADKEEARLAYQRDDPRWVPKEVRQQRAQDLLDAGVYATDPAKRAWAEREARSE